MENLFCRQRFTDFAEYREHLRYWDTEALQLSPGPLSIDYDCFDAGDLIALRLKFDQAAIFRSARDSGWVSFIVDTSAKRWCGIDVPAGSFRMIAPRRETNVITHEPWGSVCVAVRKGTLAEWGSPLADLADRDPTPEDSILDGDQGAVTAFSAWVDTLFSASIVNLTDDDADVWRAATCERVKQHFRKMLGYRVPTTTAASAVHRVARYDLALAGLRAIHRQTDHRMTVENLGRELGVTARALEYAFHGVVGVSPSRYILAARLTRARYDLRLGPLTVSSVTTVAFDHQFEHLSRFAQQYTRLFGEHPSDTLRSARSAFRQA